ncbi:MAG TPA: DUF1508 domain-containing protein [Candidatus Saccharimonadales bacterium]|nr:DUF1508 domain-containing protein [Candidatus Saccharimonadales bacterium]
MSKIWIDILKNSNTPQKYWFTIHAHSNKLAHSEMYHNKNDCIEAAMLIVNNAGEAVVYDETGEAKSDSLDDKKLN